MKLAFRNILFVGHSHVGAIREAAAARRLLSQKGRASVRTIHVLDPAHGGEFAPEQEGQRLSSGLLSSLRNQVDLHSPMIVSVLCGNMHSVLSLVEEDEPYDFILPGEASPKINPKAKLRPYAEVRKWLEGAMQLDLRRLSLFRDAVGPFNQIESPPPVAARSFIAAHIEPYFEQRPEFRRNGVAPGGVRYRMWRLSSRIIYDHCRTIGCAYLPCPKETRDESGFLARAFAQNATHGNCAYGEQIIRSVENIIDDSDVRSAFSQDC